ncbi:NrsF family protein [Sphingomonas mali]|uniref:NrsF family protein n=1 Tax=Sphingomonas mali TaxID=40682 RepID=UPI000837837D|nr:DUF1109 domain-containing protein [Sphingomonas mali]
MPSDLLIDRLVDGLRPTRRPATLRQGAVLLALAGVELAGFLSLGTLRPDIATAAGLSVFWWKMGGLASLALAATTVALRSFDPLSSPRSELRRWMAVLAGVFVLGWVLDAGSQPGLGLGARLMWQMGIECLTVMTILSTPLVLALLLMMRRGAPTDLGASATAAGAAAATAGAFIFAFHCPSDDPFYIVFWYTLGCGAITMLSRALLPRLARW